MFGLLVVLVGKLHLNRKAAGELKMLANTHISFSVCVDMNN